MALHAIFEFSFALVVDMQQTAVRNFVLFLSLTVTVESGLQWRGVNSNYPNTC